MRRRESSISCRCGHSRAHIPFWPSARDAFTIRDVVTLPQRQKTQPSQEPPDSDDEDNDDGNRDDNTQISDLTVLKIHPEIARFALEYRQVLFCFDADHLKNRAVRLAEIRAFMLFYSLGADVYQLCTWPLEEAKGVDDYLARKRGERPREAEAGLCRALQR